MGNLAIKKCANSFMETNQLCFITVKEIFNSQPGIYLMKIDSNIADQLLEINTKNRWVRKSYVDYLKNQILGGEWRNDHPHPIIISKKGRIIDGQHRLLAVQKANLLSLSPLIMRVEIGVADDLREYLDTGIPRTLADRVEFDEDHSKNKIISQLCAYAGRKGGRIGNRISPQSAWKFFELHEEAIYFIAKHKRREAKTGLTAIAFAAMEFYEIDPIKAENFYISLQKVDGEIQQSRMLRDWVLKLNSSMIQRGINYDFTVYAKSVYCMKCHLQDKIVTRVQSSKW